MIRLALGGRQRAQIEHEARAAFPRECCGLIEGIRSGELVRATAIHATRNISGQADRFEIDPAEHIAILRATRAARSEIVGCYHSHPSGEPNPSKHDIRNASDEGFVWLIAAISGPDAPASLRAFIVAKADFEPLVIE
jgi:proteasome lid subunit RPN8/RPN11